MLKMANKGNNSGIGGGDKNSLGMMKEFEKNFLQVQEILNINRMLVHQINDNHKSKIPDNIKRNVALIRQLNYNLKKVSDLYAKYNISFIKSMEDSLAAGAVSAAAAAEQSKEDRKGKKRAHPD